MSSAASGAATAPTLAAPGLESRLQGSEVPAATALACLTLVAVPGTRGILGSTASLLPVMVAGLAMHFLARLCRRRMGPVGFLVALAGSPVLVAWLVLPETTVLGIPWSDTWRAGADGMRRVLDALGTGAPPQPNEGLALRRGRMELAVLAAAVFALVADQAAFRMRQALLALLPSFTLVLLGATGAPSAHPGRSLAAYLIMAMVFLLLHHQMAGRSAIVAVSGRTPLRISTLAPAAVGVGAVAVIGSLVVGPLLPGYGRPPIVAGPNSAVSRQNFGLQMTSLVDVNPTLTERSDLVMFTVSSPIASYWRLTSLDTFDGRVWSQGLDHGSPAGLTSGYVPGVVVDQDYELENLRSDWLPAAYRAQRVEGARGYLAAGDSSTVQQREGADFERSYRVASLVPRLTEPQLKALPPPSGPALERYLALPAGLSPRVVDEAHRVTRAASGDGPYFAALALQGYFRNGFTYDLKVALSHDDDALVRFLFRTRRGYCEQFAAAFAVMARTVGLPARVAIGFTPGDRRPDGRYVVRGLHAHSWPEVYLEGAGWVAFEPTPGRGMPGAEAYTGVAPAQAVYGQADRTGFGTTSREPVPTSPTVVPTTQPADSIGGTSVPRPTPTTVPISRPDRPLPREQRRSVLPVAWAVPAVLLMAAVPLAKRTRRRSRRQRAARPNDRVMVAWAEAAEALAASGVARRPSETLLDHAARAAVHARVPVSLAEPMLVLAGRAGTASYSDRQLGEAEAAEAAVTAATVEQVLRDATPLPRRVARTLDPRPLWRLRSPRPRNSRSAPGSPAGGARRATAPKGLEPFSER